MPAVVFFDMETTHLNDTVNQLQLGVELVSIGAVCGGNRFEVFVIPECDISAESAGIHGMTKSDGKLYLRGSQLRDAVHPKEALDRFGDFLRSLPGGKVTLVAHCCAKSDSWFLCRNLAKYGVDYSDVVVDFVDSMALEYSMRTGREVYNFSQNDLTRKYLGVRREGAHNALADAEGLEKVVNAMARKVGMGMEAFMKKPRKQGPISFTDRMWECKRW